MLKEKRLTRSESDEVLGEVNLAVDGGSHDSSDSSKADDHGGSDGALGVAGEVGEENQFLECC